MPSDVFVTRCKRYIDGSDRTQIFAMPTCQAATRVDPTLAFFVIDFE
jgi:hypothetical protein